MKKKTLFFSFIIFFLFLTFGFVEAALVPCGGNGQSKCEICHIFVLFDNIVNFVLFKIVPPIAVLMFVIAGIMYYFYAENPSSIEQAKNIMKSAAIGLVLVYGAWVIVNSFFLLVGIADWTGLKEGWFKIECAGSGTTSGNPPGTSLPAALPGTLPSPPQEPPPPPY